MAGRRAEHTNRNHCLLPFHQVLSEHLSQRNSQVPPPFLPAVCRSENLSGVKVGASLHQGDYL